LRLSISALFAQYIQEFDIKCRFFFESAGLDNLNELCCVYRVYRSKLMDEPTIPMFVGLKSVEGGYFTFHWRTILENFSDISKETQEESAFEANCREFLRGEVDVAQPKTAENQLGISCSRAEGVDRPTKEA
jgi:hypothetical protein